MLPLFGIDCAETGIDVTHTPSIINTVRVITSASEIVLMFIVIVKLLLLSSPFRPNVSLLCDILFKASS